MANLWNRLFIEVALLCFLVNEGVESRTKGKVMRRV